MAFSYGSHPALRKIYHRIYPINWITTEKAALYMGASYSSPFFLEAITFYEFDICPRYHIVRDPAGTARSRICRRGSPSGVIRSTGEIEQLFGQDQFRPGGGVRQHPALHVGCHGLLDVFTGVVIVRDRDGKS